MKLNIKKIFFLIFFSFYILGTKYIIIFQINPKSFFFSYLIISFFLFFSIMKPNQNLVNRLSFSSYNLFIFVDGGPTKGPRNVAFKGWMSGGDIFKIMNGLYDENRIMVLFGNLSLNSISKSIIEYTFFKNSF